MTRYWPLIGDGDCECGGGRDARVPGGGGAQHVRPQGAGLGQRQHQAAGICCTTMINIYSALELEPKAYLCLIYYQSS